MKVLHVHAVEVFRVTSWGVVPTLDQLHADFPPIQREASNLDGLAARLKRWQNAG